MRKLYFVAACLLLDISFAAAQETIDLQMMQKIRDEEKNNSQIAMIAHNLTDVAGPRLTNSPGYNRALDWTTEICKKWGLQNSGREAWGEFGKGWNNEVSSLAMKVPYNEDIIAYPAPWSKGTDKTVKAELIMIDRLDSASIDKLGDAIKGKIVMVKPESETIPGAYKPNSTRYGDSSLDNLADKYMFTADMLTMYLPFMKKETLIMMGSDDQIVPMANGKFLKMLIPDSELLEIKDGGHLFMLSHVDESVAAIRDFLDRPVEAQRKAA